MSAAPRISWRNWRQWPQGIWETATARSAGSPAAAALATRNCSAWTDCDSGTPRNSRFTPTKTRPLAPSPTAPTGNREIGARARFIADGTSSGRRSCTVATPAAAAARLASSALITNPVSSAAAADAGLGGTCSSPIAQI
uniref:CDA1 n=1 Tax=Arundo donax TaxID=35708 RepID=A0A0A9FMN7_ARUDO